MLRACYSRKGGNKMKFIIAAIIIFCSAFLWTIYSIVKTVSEYDRAEEERMRREIWEEKADERTEEGGD